MIVHPSAGKHVPLFSLVKCFSPSPMSTVIVGISVFAQWTQSQRKRGWCLSCLNASSVCRSASLMWRHRNSIKKSFFPLIKITDDTLLIWALISIKFTKCVEILHQQSDSPLKSTFLPHCAGFCRSFLYSYIEALTGFLSLQDSLILQCCLSVCSVSCWVLIIRAA